MTGTCAVGWLKVSGFPGPALGRAALPDGG